MLTKISQVRANEAVYSALRQAILSSLLRPGEKLNIHDLAGQLGVSLTPVRNAIHLLSAEGLVEVAPRSGTFVAKVGAQEVRETFEIRRALECLAVENMVRLASDDEIYKLKRLVEAMEKPVKDLDDLKRHQSDNTQFHLLLVAGGRNDRLLTQYRNLNAHIQIARVHAEETDWAERLPVESMEHHAIVDALAGRDAEAAVAAARRHIDRSCESLIQAIEKRDANPES